MHNKQEQTKVWDKIAESWNRYRSEAWLDVLPFIESLLKEKKGKALEVGCGNCRNLIPFAKAGFECYGIDFSQKMISEAEKNAKNNEVQIALSAGDIANIKFKDNFFDTILCIAVLHHLPKEKQQSAVNKLFRVLKNDGKILISVWNKNNDKKERYVNWNIEDEEIQRYYYFFSPDELKKLMKRSGFKILDEKIGKNIVFLVEKQK